MDIPRPLKLEHEELHDELTQATKAPGAVGEAARRVAELLHPHFVKEEEFALPLLGLLSALVSGEVTADMRAAVAMSERLRAELPDMLAEHRRVQAALESLAEAARRALRPDLADFARKLALHAEAEEEVMYPAALLVGEVVRARLGAPSA